MPVQIHETLDNKTLYINFEEVVTGNRTAQVLFRMVMMPQALWTGQYMKLRDQVYQIKQGD